MQRAREKRRETGRFCCWEAVSLAVTPCYTQVVASRCSRGSRHGIDGDTAGVPGMGRYLGRFQMVPTEQECFATDALQRIPAPNTAITSFVVSLISDGRIHEDHCDEVWNTMQAHGITKPTGIQCRRGLFETVVAWWQQDHRLVGGAGWRCIATSCFLMFLAFFHGF